MSSKIKKSNSIISIKKKTNKNSPEKKKSPLSNKSSKKLLNNSEDNIEKKMLKGQKHINSETDLDPKMQKQKHKKKKHHKYKRNGKSQKLLIKKIIKPREIYLQNKIKNNNYNPSLISSINISLYSQIKDIEEDLEDDKILITEKERDLNLYLSKSIRNDSNDLTNKNPQEQYLIKTRKKELSQLKEEQDLIKQKLSKLIENEKVLQNEDNSDSIIIDKSLFLINKRLKEKELKKIKKQKEELKFDITQIDFKINGLIKLLKDENKKEKLKEFITNFERDKEIAEQRAKKYYENSKKIKQHMLKDINKLMRKRKNDLDNLQQLQISKKNEAKKKFIIIEKEMENKRYLENLKKASFYRSFCKEKPQIDDSELLFNINKEKYINSEERYNQLEREKRKNLMKSFNKEELSLFTKEHDDNKEKYNILSKKKQIDLFKEWKKRKNALPRFISSFLDKAKNEDEKEQKLNKIKKENIENLFNNKKEYSEKVLKEKIPSIDRKLLNKRLDSIYRQENPLKVLFEETKTKIENRKIEEVKKDEVKRCGTGKKFKLSNIINTLNKTEIINQNLIHKPIRVNYSVSFDKNIEHKSKDKKIDYLKEIIEKKKEKKKSFLTRNIFNIPNSKKWELMFNNSENDISNIEKVREKADLLEIEAEKKEKLLKGNGGIEYNSEMVEQVSRLMIDSIKAKLCIIDKINQKLP